MCLDNNISAVGVRTYLNKCVEIFSLPTIADGREFAQMLDAAAPFESVGRHVTWMILFAMPRPQRTMSPFFNWVLLKSDEMRHFWMDNANDNACFAFSQHTSPSLIVFSGLQISALVCPCVFVFVFLKHSIPHDLASFFFADCAVQEKLQPTTGRSRKC